MIPRYSRPAMVSVWEPSNRFRIWFEIEAYACEAQAQLGHIPQDTSQEIWAKGNKPYTAERITRIEEIEQITRHDVIAFTTELAEHVGEASRFVHQGMTSSDVLDTCLAVQLSQATDVLLSDLDAVLSALKKRAFEHRSTVCIGRSHGIHAEPTTMGLKFAGFYAEFQRSRERLQRARLGIATCALSGAVGTFANINPFVESYVAEKLGLVPEPISTQVIPRDRHAEYFSTLAIIASSIEHLATEIRHLQRTEVREAEEFFAQGQKGSSAMPHKRNPVLTENLTGLARLVRGYVIPALENVALWHERDISHSSVERVSAPDATIALDFALSRLADVVGNLCIYPEAIKRNLEQTNGLIFSQRVLLALIHKGVSREGAYEMVQRTSMKVWAGEGDLMSLLKDDRDVMTYTTEAELACLFDLSWYTKHVDTLFERVFGDSTA